MSAEMDEKLEKLLDGAITEMKKKISKYTKESEHNERIIKEFGLWDYYNSIPDELCGVADVADMNVALNLHNQKLEKLNNEVTLGQLETYLNQLNNMLKCLEEYRTYLQKEIEKYEDEYAKQCHARNQDDLDFTNLQTTIHKLQADIHQANEKQEPKSLITAKLSQCFDIHKEIARYESEVDRLKSELASVRHLPANISEAEKKLNNLKKKFKEVSIELSKKIAQ